MVLGELPQLEEDSGSRGKFRNWSLLRMGDGQIEGA